uniref:NADH-ubiquinone oxidoreductase chain 4L n=2 Tax=Psyttalia TaxID=283796 RepID=A0A8A4JEM6_9HYME|nr:NADH dehydrogenase subunit 4L [Psyttalia concolor]QTC30732.1 NADH dehydrogenase subunit 4L [Psyttalia humilis]
MFIWMNLNLMILMFLMSCFFYSSYYKHILLTLISLEFMMINLMMNMYMILIKLNINIFIISMFISIMVCEGILGLSILVHMIRNSGNDYSLTLNLIKW